MMNDLVNDIRKRYVHALDRIAEAAGSAGRSPESVELVVVTKSQPLEVVQAAIDAGIRILGENYPEEGVRKIQALARQSAVEWHMIGHVQSRKAGLVAQHFNLMHSLDSLKLANKLNRACEVTGHDLPVLLEFNVGGEDSKSGWLASDKARWPDLLAEMDAVVALPHLCVKGLMAMPPPGDSAEFSRPYFQLLRRLQDYLMSQFPQTNWMELSMGTSADFEIAVQEGATLVRVGTAIVGPRHYKTED